MTRTRFCLLSGLVCALLGPAASAAQVEAPLVLELPASTEALGLGNVFPVSGRDPDAVFYNPAAVVRATGVGLSGQRIAGATALSGSGALPWLGGGVAVGLQALAYDAAAGRAPGLSDLVEEGDVAVSELAASVGYARELGEIRVGAVAKLVEERIGGLRASGGALDLGAAADIAFLSVGLSVQHLGSDLKLGDLALEMPDRVTLSASFEPTPVGPLDVRAAAAVSRRADGELIPAGGLDVRFWPVQGRTFIARIGARRVPDGPAKPVTFGLAFWGDAIALEYAFQGFEGSDDAHRIGLRWRR